MAASDRSRRKCFTFIWKLENARFCWHDNGKGIASPKFIVNEIEDSKWKLKLLPGKSGNVGLHLLRLTDINTINVEIDAEIALLALNGEVLPLGRCTKKTFGLKSRSFLCSVKREIVFPERGSSFNFGETITTRCKIWKSVGEISKDVQCIARTRISVLKTSFIWNIENFSSLELEKNYPHDIKSLEDNRKLMSLCFFIKRDQKLFISVSSVNQEIKFYTFIFSAINSSGDTIESLRKEICCNKPDESNEKIFSLSKKELMEKKIFYLPNDVLSIMCKGAISFGIVSEEILSISYEGTDFVRDEMDNCYSDKEDIVPVSENVLIESFKSVLNEENESPLIKSLTHNLRLVVNTGSLSDIKLRTSSQTYRANMFILSARSSVFRDLFSTEMNQRANDYVDIEEVDDDTFSRILHYIYRSEVDQLQWRTATKLYVGASKYKIFDLKAKCSLYIKKNLSRTNACEALILAHEYEDKDLEDIVQRFILKNTISIVNSTEWDELKEKYSKLAADTLSRKFKKTPKISEKKQENLQESQNLPKKRKLAQKDTKTNHSIITNFFPKLKETHANTVDNNCSSSLQLSKNPTVQKGLEFDAMRDLPSTSRIVDTSLEMENSTTDVIDLDIEMTQGTS